MYSKNYLTRDRLLKYGMISLITSVLPLILYKVPAGFCLSVVTAILISASLGIIIISASSLKEKHFLLKLFLAGFFLRVFVSVILYVLLLGLGGDGFAIVDDRTYDLSACEMAHTWQKEQNHLLWAPLGVSRGYNYLCAVLYFMFGCNTVVARVFNCFIGALTVIYVYQVANYFFTKNIARIAALLAAFFPVSVLWSSVQFKDTIVAFLTVYTIYNAFKLKENTRVSDIIKIIVGISILVTFRKQTFVILLFASIAYILIDFRPLKFRLRSITAALCIIILASFITYVLGFGFLGKEIYKEKYGEIELIRLKYKPAIESAAEPGSLVYAIQQYDIREKPYIAPVAFVFVLLQPFPPWKFASWRYDYNLFHNLLLIANWSWIFFLMPCSLYGIYFSARYRITGSFFLYMIWFIIILGIAIVFAGATSRQIVQVIPISMIFAAIGIIEFRRWRSLFCFYIFGFLGAGAILYIYLKYLRDLGAQSILIQSILLAIIIVTLLNRKRIFKIKS